MRPLAMATRLRMRGSLMVVTPPTGGKVGTSRRGPSASSRKRSTARSLACIQSVGRAACSGCWSKPPMRLDHAEISGVQLATLPPSIDVVMTIFLDVYNPNGYDVAVRAVRGQTILAGRFPLPVDYHAPGDGLWLPAHQPPT